MQQFEKKAFLVVAFLSGVLFVLLVKLISLGMIGKAWAEFKSGSRTALDILIQGG